MSRGKRGIGLNKPCIKCGTEVPSVFVSPVQPGLCGKCTTEALKANKRMKAPSVRTIFSEKSPGLKIIVFLAAGLVAGFAIAILLSAAAPSAWEALSGPVRGLFT